MDVWKRIGFRDCYYVAGTNNCLPVNDTQRRGVDIFFYSFIYGIVIN